MRIRAPYWQESEGRKRRVQLRHLGLDCEVSAAGVVGVLLGKFVAAVALSDVHALGRQAGRRWRVHLVAGAHQVPRNCQVILLARCSGVHPVQMAQRQQA